MSRHTPEQAAILSLLDRFEALNARIAALEAENRSLNARVSSVVAVQRAAAVPPGRHLRLVKQGLQAKGAVT
jgi:hypothetical protein